MLAALDVFEAQVREVYEAGLVQMQSVADGEILYPEPMHLVALYASFQGDYYRLMLEWIDFARREVATWDTTVGVGFTKRTRHLIAMSAEGRSVLHD